MAEIQRFRLLIIGKTGCGKTTILSKVCGEDVADRPSTRRGVHDIERELVFHHNDKLVAHDSEGFEAGQSKEVDAVTGFIERRAEMEDVNERLHMVWYCIEMSSRPIQHAERDFFSTSKKVPVIVVVTKFDIFVQDVLQDLEEAAYAEGRDIDDDEMETRAVQEAEARFNEYYKSQLNDLPYPPKAIAHLSRTHESKPDDSRLGELIRRTMEALEPPDNEDTTPERREEQRKLKELFVTAQTADLLIKMEESIYVGLSVNYGDIGHRPIHRERMINIWNIPCDSKLHLTLERHIDFSPRLIGHPESPDLEKIQRWSFKLRDSARLEQMVIDTTLVMRHLSGFRRGSIAVPQLLVLSERLVEWYSLKSATAKLVRNVLVETHDEHPEALVGMSLRTVAEMFVRLPLEPPDLGMEPSTSMALIKSRPTRFPKFFKRRDPERKAIVKPTNEHRAQNYSIPGQAGSGEQATHEQRSVSRSGASGVADSSDTGPPRLTLLFESDEAGGSHSGLSTIYEDLFMPPINHIEDMQSPPHTTTAPSQDLSAGNTRRRRIFGRLISRGEKRG